MKKTKSKQQEYKHKVHKGSYGRQREFTTDEIKQRSADRRKRKQTNYLI